MPAITSYDHGVPCWIDLGTTDPERTAAFYGGLFGWSTQDMGGGYHLALLDGRAVAGLGPSEGPPHFWTTYLSVPDAAATTELVREAGGTVLVEPVDGGGPGISAMFRDPAGAAFSVWQPLDFAGGQVGGEPGALAWTELWTPDLDGALDFYTEVLPWVADLRSATRMWWEVDGRPVAGATQGERAEWVVSIAVADVEASVRRAVSLGGTAGEGHGWIVGPHGEGLQLIPG